MLKSPFWWLLVLVGCVGLSTSSYGQSSCLTCHSDPTVMKKLVIPPSALASEGEG